MTPNEQGSTVAARHLINRSKKRSREVTRMPVAGGGDVGDAVDGAGDSMSCGEDQRHEKHTHEGGGAGCDEDRGQR
ncbi:hypothetical protein BHM03_00048395 [Ensete ventricosum]|nr:hypothetical protein BHM03_00048395 [Ensete ventricosum]